MICRCLKPLEQALRRPDTRNLQTSSGSHWVSLLSRNMQEKENFRENIENKKIYISFRAFFAIFLPTVASEIFRKSNFAKMPKRNFASTLRETQQNLCVPIQLNPFKQYRYTVVVTKNLQETSLLYFFSRVVGAVCQWSRDADSRFYYFSLFS